MSIYSLRIQNYKTIRDSKIEFKGNISGIYGPNGTGKTAILEILHIVKEYFTYAHNPIFEKDSRTAETDIYQIKKMIQNGIRKGEDTLRVELVLLIDDTLYKIEVEFKVKKDSVSVVRETFSLKENNSRKKFRDIIKISNEEDEILPVMYLNNKEQDRSEIIEVQSRKKNSSRI